MTRWGRRSRSNGTPVVATASRISPRTSKLVIRRLLVERIPCPSPDAERVHAFLASRGIVHGVREDAVGRRLTGLALAEQIAWGTRPVEPEDGELTLSAQSGPVQSGRPLVGAGRHGARGPAGAGHRRPPATRCSGDLVPVRAPRRAAIEIGENVLVSADGTRLVAAIDGFPRVGAGRIDVAPAARIDRDLDDRTGDIQAHGSLDLHGGVTAGPQLKVRRDLSVTGSIERAEVEVGGSATIDGIAMSSYAA